MSGLTEQERDELFTAVDTYRRKLYVDERPLRNGDPVLVYEAVERIVAERERAALARVTALLTNLEQPASECGEEHAKREYAAEGDAEMVALIGDHYPTKYKPYCDGCAAASSADSERGEIAKQLRAAIEGGDQ